MDERDRPYRKKLEIHPGSSVDHRQECPDCGHPILLKWSGVECASDDCKWWFCY